MFVLDNNTSMGKDISKHLVGQPIFKLIIDLLPKNKFDCLVSEKCSDKYYKTFTTWDQLVTEVVHALPITLPTHFRSIQKSFIRHQRSLEVLSDMTLRVRKVFFLGENT